MDDDRALATAALQDPTGPARDRLVLRLLPPLEALARAKSSSWPRLRAQTETPDMVQGFLTAKVLPLPRLQVLLAPVVAGTKPLLPRVGYAFIQYLKDLDRRAKRTPPTVPLGGRDELDPADAPAQTIDPWPDVTAHIAAQQEAICQTFPVPASGPPFGAVLLLEVRLDLAQAIAASFQPPDGRTAADPTLVEVVETVAGWTAADTARVFATSRATLGQVWEEILQRTERQPQFATRSQVLDIVHVSPDTWNQWKSRARKRLLAALGLTAARRLFPTWPQGVFERAAESEQGGSP
jgi:hypothetical protein